VNVSTLAGNGTKGFADGTGGPTGAAMFNNVEAVSVDNAGNVYVADAVNNRIRKIAPNGVTTTLAGNGTAGLVNGTGGASGTTEFNQPGGIAVDGAGNVYVSDTYITLSASATDGSTTTLVGMEAALSMEPVPWPSSTSHAVSRWTAPAIFMSPTISTIGSAK